MPSAQPPYHDIEALIRAMHRECGRAAFGIVRNYADAEDAVQSACIKVFLMWPRVGGFPTAGRQRAYLLRAVRNEALQVLRKRKRRKEDYDLGESGNPRIPERLTELARDRKALRIGYGEIAAMLDISVSTVRSHIGNARKNLRRAMPGDWEGE